MSTLFDTPPAPPANAQPLPDGRGSLSAPVPGPFPTAHSPLPPSRSLHPDPWALLAGLLREVLTPRPKLSVPEWTAKNRVIAASGGAKPGAWQHWRTPHAVKPMRLLGGAALGGDPRVREVVLEFGPQCCKTEILNNAAMARLAQDPTPTLWIVPNEDWAGHFTKNRFYPALRECAALMEMCRKRDMQVASLTLSNGAFVWWVASNSGANAKGTPAGQLLIDELDSAGFNPRAVQDGRDRGSAWPGFIFGIASTPSFKGVGIDAEYETTNREKWYTPCPLCGFYQRLMFKGLVWHGRTKADPDAVEKTVKYQCENTECRGAIDPGRLGWMNERGFWCPDGVRPEGDGRAIPAELLASGYLDDTDPAVVAAVNPRGEALVKSVARVGFQFVTMMSNLFAATAAVSYASGWGKIAREFVEAKGHPAPEWWNSIGEVAPEQGERASEHELGKLCAPAAALGGYELGELPGGPGVVGAGGSKNAWGYSDEPARPNGAEPTFGGPLSLLASIDVQAGSQGNGVARVLVRAFGARGEHSWLVWVEEIPCKVGNNLVELDRIFEWRFGWQRPPGREQIQRGAPLGHAIYATFVDSGDRTDEAYAFKRRAQGKGYRVFPVKGEHTPGSGMAPPVRRSALDVDAEGKRIPGALGGAGGLELVLVRVAHYKDMLYGRLLAAVEAQRTGGNPGVYALPCGTPAEYLAAMCSEHRVPVTTKDGRRTSVETRWVPREGIHGKNNHYWDCEVYVWAGAELLGVRLLGAEGQRENARTRNSGTSEGGGAERGDDGRGAGAGGAGGGNVGGPPALRSPMLGGSQDWLRDAREKWGRR